MKHRRTITIIGSLLALLLLSFNSVFALESDDGYIELESPVNNTVYYQGERLEYSFTSYDTWKYLYTRPSVYIANEDTQEYYLSKSFHNVEVNGYDNYTGSYNTKKLPVGKYHFSVMHLGYESAYDDDDDFYETDNEPYIAIFFKVKELKAPTNIKAISGKKRVSISFKKSTGAKKYEIYRCQTKQGTYKRIGTTVSNKYTDKTVKKGKKYYYKIKSVRTGKGTVKSKFSTVKRSGKVK